MKTNELMIGDWVCIKDYPMTAQPMQVKEEHFVRSLVDFEPIPLTKEILEKNADNHYDERYYDIYFFHDYDDGELVEITSGFGRIEWTINGNEYGITEIKYVHELQHALRLCKIEKEIVL